MLKLNTICKNVKKYNKPFSGTVAGVITDITMPLYREKEGNYIVMLKLIDQTLNNTKIYGVMVKSCTVYLLSKNKEDINFLKGIGDIIILDKFQFQIWNGIKLQTRYRGTTQGLYHVSINSNRQISTISHLTSNPQLFQMNQQIVGRIQELSCWVNQSLVSVFMPKIGIHILNNHYATIDPFDIILKFKKSQPNNKAFRLQLIDVNQNTFYLLYQSDKFQAGQLLFVRGIKFIGQSFHIQLTQTGRILEIPAYIEYLELMNYMTIFRDNEKFIKEKAQNQLTILQSYSLETTPLKELIELKDIYDHSKEKQKNKIKDTYMVEVIVLNYEGHIKLYHKECQILVDKSYFEEIIQEKKIDQLSKNKIGFIYEGVIGLIDRSNDNEGKPFYVNVFTCDEKGSIIEFDRITEKQRHIGTNKENQAKRELQQMINKKISRLIKKSTFEKPALLLLQPIKSQKLDFRIVNTIIS